MAEIDVSSIQIEKDVPLSGRGNSKYSPVAEKMEIGDSVFCDTKAMKNGLVSALNRINFGTNVRPETKDGVEGFRVWCRPKRCRPAKKAD